MFKYKNCSKDSHSCVFGNFNTEIESFADFVEAVNVVLHGEAFPKWQRSGKEVAKWGKRQEGKGGKEKLKKENALNKDS